MKENKGLYNALIWRLGQMVKENVELEQRVHKLMDDYNRVAKQLQGKEKHEATPTGYAFGELTEALNKCESLENDKKDWQRKKRDLEKLYNELQERCTAAEGNYTDLRSLADQYEERIARFEQSEFVRMNKDCVYRPFAPGENPISVGSYNCIKCPHMMKIGMIEDGYVLCACRYDSKKCTEAQENKATDE